jgi:hypothetical protein
MNAIPNRRGLLLGAVTAGAAASVAAIPAIAAAETPDPIFARIEPLNAATAHIDAGIPTTTLRTRRPAALSKPRSTP